MSNPFSIAIHGGAGTILKEQMSKELKQSIISDLQNSVRAGYKVLEQGGDALDAVVAAVKVLEDSPNFNAGKGSVLTHKEIVEMDASVMNGEKMQAGAVAGVRHIKNPIALARDVMNNSKHVFLVGEGAEEFAFQNGYDYTEQDYFYTERRYEQLQHMKSKGEYALSESRFPDDKKFGTVGAVALDSTVIWRQQLVQVVLPTNNLVELETLRLSVRVRLLKMVMSLFQLQEWASYLFVKLWQVMLLRECDICKKIFKRPVKL